ncbi:glycine cleavage system aminomethyltransferase GcvT [Aurantiacibacter luteus]|nr:glycine cleavage system aminomethyltransferase GcvT [Aurantiacibacter luteus]
MSDPQTDIEAPPATLPLDAWHRDLGARMVPFAGYEMPIQYAGEHGGIVAEHNWTRTHAGLFDVSHMGQLYVSGEGAEAALEAVLPIDLSTMTVGQVRYSLLLDENGGVLDDLMVTRWGTGFYLVVNGATKWDDIATLREHLPDEVSLNHLEDSALLALQGPEAATALARVTEGDFSALTFMRGGEFAIDGVPAWISRSGYTGEDGFEISVPAAEVARVASLLLDQPEVQPIGLGARDSLRLEAGLPLYGHDLSPETSPIEAGLVFGINKRRRADTGGGFPGCERIRREIAEGTGRKLVGLALEGRLPAREGADVYSGDIKVGTVTSGGFSPTLGYPIAMAYVDAASAAQGSDLTCEVRGKHLPARVVPLPFVPHNYHRKGA